MMKINDKLIFRLIMIFSVLCFIVIGLYVVSLFEKSAPIQVVNNESILVIKPVIRYFTEDGSFEITSKWQYGSYRELINGQRNYMDYLKISGEDIIGESFWLKTKDTWYPAVKSDYTTLTLRGDTDEIQIVLNQKNTGIELDLDRATWEGDFNPDINGMHVITNDWDEKLYVLTYDTSSLKQSIREGNEPTFTVNIPIRVIDECLFKTPEEYATCFAVAQTQKRLDEANSGVVLIPKPTKTDKDYTVSTFDTATVTDSVTLNQFELSDVSNATDRVRIYLNGELVPNNYTITLSDSISLTDEIIIQLNGVNVSNHHIIKLNDTLAINSTVTVQ